MFSSTEVLSQAEEVSSNMRFRDTSHQLTVIELEESRYNPKIPSRVYNSGVRPYGQRLKYHWAYEECFCDIMYLDSHKTKSPVVCVRIVGCNLFINISRN